ncbi:hypothetical protein HZ326_24675 [Fusarium oxysporum f. sp. albedinis]|nr:hypothetical protein HZ326_24675 [Fusarium oxysporum f. sp. albedinis]
MHAGCTSDLGESTSLSNYHPKADLYSSNSNTDTQRPCTSVDGNSDEGTLDPASETVSRLENKRQLQSHDISRLNQLVPRLKEDQQLQSDDIWLIMKYLIPYSDDWHVFDPGYPMDKSPPRRRLVSANNIICILNESGHWSLCRLNKADGHFDHYNSLVRINKPTA